MRKDCYEQARDEKTTEAKQNDLWSRIKALVEKEDVSYLVAIEKWQGHIKEKIS